MELGGRILIYFIFIIMNRRGHNIPVGESPRLPTSPNTDPLSYLSNFKRYQTIICT